MIRDTSQSQNIDYPSYVRAENRRIRPLHRLKNNGQKRYILNADSLITSVAAAPTHSNAKIVEKLSSYSWIMFESYYDYDIIKSTHYNKNNNNESPEIDRNETYQS